MRCLLDGDFGPGLGSDLSRTNRAGGGPAEPGEAVGGVTMKPSRIPAPLALGVALVALAGSVTARPMPPPRATHVRWDIISLVGGAFPGPVNPGGMASAMAPNGGDTITLTGSGTFVARSGGNGGSHAVTGGGTWQTSTGSGNYTVKELVRFDLANFQSSTPAVIDNIGDVNQRVNGTAVLRVQYDDGSPGVLTVGCHGPGAPAGIFEGIAVTKGFTTYYNVQPPAAGVDANRTLFHVVAGKNEDEQ